MHSIVDIIGRFVFNSGDNNERKMKGGPQIWLVSMSWWVQVHFFVWKWYNKGNWSELSRNPPSIPKECSKNDKETLENPQMVLKNLEEFGPGIPLYSEEYEDFKSHFLPIKFNQMNYRKGN